LQIIARQVSDDMIEQLRNMFLSIDEDNSGTLTVEEIGAALVKLEVDDKVRMEMQRIMSELGSGGNINYTEFIAATITKQYYLREEVCRAAFQIFDVDGDGFISHQDLSTLLATCSEDDEDGMSSLRPEEITQIMAEVDDNGDGKMDFDEFMKLMEEKPAVAISPMTPMSRKHVCVEDMVNRTESFSS